MTKDQIIELVVRVYKVSQTDAVNMLDLASQGILGKKFQAISKQFEIEMLKKALDGNGPE